MAGVSTALALSGRIQGFGNCIPSPLEEDTGSDFAKRAASRLGDIVGEEVMLTVEDFREKGAVGAVKDAVADAGDILIDGVASIIGFLRGDPMLEDDAAVAKEEEATQALSNGPTGAAYGISQASPTGGINAVWVMPEEADPAALAQLARQQEPYKVARDPRIPANIAPYEPPLGSYSSPISASPSVFSTASPASRRWPGIVPYESPNGSCDARQAAHCSFPSSVGPLHGLIGGGGDVHAAVAAASSSRVPEPHEASEAQLREIVLESARRLQQGRGAASVDSSLSRLLQLMQNLDSHEKAACVSRSASTAAAVEVDLIDAGSDGPCDQADLLDCSGDVMEQAPLLPLESEPSPLAALAVQQPLSLLGLSPVCDLALPEQPQPQPQPSLLSHAEEPPPHPSEEQDTFGFVATVMSQASSHQ